MKTVAVAGVSRKWSMEDQARKKVIKEYVGELDKLLQVHKNILTDDHMVGMYNGLLVAKATLTGEDISEQLLSPISKSLKKEENKDGKEETGTVIHSEGGDGTSGVGEESV